MTKKKNPADLLPRGRPRIDGATPGTVPDDPPTYLQINLLTSQKTWLLAEAQRQGISVSELLRQWLEEKRSYEREQPTENETDGYGEIIRIVKNYLAQSNSESPATAKETA